MKLQKSNNDNEKYIHLYPQAEAYIVNRLGFFSEKKGLLSTRYLIACALYDVEGGKQTLEEAEKGLIKDTLDIATDFWESCSSK